MNQVHLHYTKYPTNYFAVSCFGLTPEQLKYYAQKAGFFVINTRGETQRFISRKLHPKMRLYRVLENAGYTVSTSSDVRDAFPPIPATLPESLTAKTWLGDGPWYCGDAS